MRSSRPAGAAGAVMLAVALALAVAAPAHADTDPVIGDGDFEGGVLAYPHVYTGGDSIGAWTVANGNVAVHSGGLGVGSEQAALYNYDPAAGPVVSAISQTFETTVGGHYQLTYWVHGEGQFETVVEGSTVDSFANTPFTWSQRVVVFVADSISTTLTFRSSSDDPTDEVSAAFIDNISVLRQPDGPIIHPIVAVGAAVLALVGAAGVVALRRNRPKEQS